MRVQRRGSVLLRGAAEVTDPADRAEVDARTRARDSVACSKFARSPWGATSAISSTSSRTSTRTSPTFIRPLDQDLKDRLNPKKNPLFEHAEGTIFLAYRNGKCVGRITATIDHEHLARHKDATGFWGFFDTIDDAEVARELLARAEAWLRGKGMKRARGPISMSINEELGCLVEGSTRRRCS